MNPYIGLIVDFYPSPSERNCALVVNVHPEQDKRPRLDLQVFQPDGKLIFKQQVPSVEDDPVSNEPALFVSWGFAHEFAILQEPDHDPSTEDGINSNEMVGQISNRIYEV